MVYDEGSGKELPELLQPHCTTMLNTTEAVDSACFKSHFTP